MPPPGAPETLEEELRNLQVTKKGALIHSAWSKFVPQDHPAREWILEGVKEGFSITDKQYEGLPVQQRNSQSALGDEYRAEVEKQIRVELENGRYIKVKNPPHIISGLAAIPKPESTKI